MRKFLRFLTKYMLVKSIVVSYRILCSKMFHPEYDAFGEDHFRAQDPVDYYNALYNHVFSKKSKELSHQKQLLQNFKPDFRVKF